MTPWLPLRKIQLGLRAGQERLEFGTRGTQVPRNAMFLGSSRAGLIASLLLVLVAWVGPAHAQQHPVGAMSDQESSDAPDPPDTTYGEGAIAPSAAAIRGFAKVPTYRAFLPPSVRLDSTFPRPGNQGRQGSCVGWAVGYAARSHYVANEGRNLSDLANIPSPAYIYNLAVASKPRKGCDGGMVISDAFETLEQGAVSMAEMPYSDSTCSNPHTEMRARANQFRIKSYEFVDPSALDTLKGELAAGHPVVFGAYLATSFMRHRGASTYNRSPSDPLRRNGSHAMVLIGYDEARQAFRIQNSWGRGWGDGGRAWLSYVTFAKDTHSAFVMRPIGTVPPKPAPAPAPPPVPPPFAELECGRVQLAPADGGIVARGFVRSDEDLARLRQQLAGKAARLEVEVRPWPQCETLLTLDKRLDGADRPTVRIANDSGSLFRGDPLVIEVTAPEQPAHLHIAYVQADGSVVHLLQNTPDNLRTYDNRQKLTFGDGGPGKAAFKVAAPFGNEMVLVLASRTPVFIEPRPQQETERDFLTALRRALLWKADPSGADRDISAAYVAIVTKDHAR